MDEACPRRDRRLDHLFDRFHYHRIPSPHLITLVHLRHGFREQSDGGFETSRSQGEEGQGTGRKGRFPDDNPSFTGTQFRPRLLKEGLL